jgi:hypothetical protein
MTEKAKTGFKKAGGLKLALMHAPTLGSTLAEWNQAVDDGEEFMRRWGWQAAALGWTVESLAGLIWNLRGRQVAAMTAKEATLRDTGGKITFYRRCPAS